MSNVQCAMSEPGGFACTVCGKDRIIIYHLGKKAATLSGMRATRLRVFMETASERQLQHKLASMTGNYKRGNERRSSRGSARK